MTKKRVSILQREGIKLSAFNSAQLPRDKASAAGASCLQSSTHTQCSRHGRIKGDEREGDALASPLRGEVVQR